MQTLENLIANFHSIFYDLYCSSFQTVNKHLNQTYNISNEQINTTFDPKYKRHLGQQIHQLLMT